MKVNNDAIDFLQVSHKKVFVKLLNKRVGTIHLKDGNWSYTPKGGSEGDKFDALWKCKQSLMEPEDLSIG